MFEATRRHPRVPVNQSCILIRAGAGTSTEHPSISLPARAVSVAREGMGLKVMQPEALGIAKGDTVSVTVKVHGVSRRLTGTVVWRNESHDSDLHVGVHFGDEGDSDQLAYQEWVDQGFEELRQQTTEAGGEMAWRREVSLRKLQAALDTQARDGGELGDILATLAD